MSFNDLITITGKYGFNGLLIFIVLFIIYTLISSHWFSDIFSKFLDRKFSSKKKTLDITISNIENHNMFNYIEHWIYQKVPTIKFSTEYRTIVFRKYLTILLMKYRDNTQHYVASKVYDKMNEDELWKSILNLINTIVYDYINGGLKGQFVIVDGRKIIEKEIEH
jgi:hypothetical protein